jgi:hypothetical protein
VQPSAALEGSGITGVAAVVLGVRELEEAAAQFRKAYGWVEAAREEIPEFGASLAHFPGTPVILAAAVVRRASRPHVGRQDAGPTLRDRLERFGECPAGFLLKAGNFARAVQRFSLTPGGSWFGRRVAWFDPSKIGAMRLGVVESATDSSMP